MSDKGISQNANLALKDAAGKMNGFIPGLLPGLLFCLWATPAHADFPANFGTQLVVLNIVLVLILAALIRAVGKAERRHRPFAIAGLVALAIGGLLYWAEGNIRVLGFAIAIWTPVFAVVAGVAALIYYVWRRFRG